MASETVLYSMTGRVARITLNRPDRRNLINQQLADELAEACLRAELDDGVYLVALTGAGEAFCAGSELAPGQSYPAAAVAGISKPVIAAINGDALGEGLELALACDIRLAAASARLGLPQVSGGRLPADGGTQRLARIVGRARALEMLLTAQDVTAAEALAIGLVSRVAECNLAAELDALVENLSAKAPLSLRFIKEAVGKGMDLTLEQGLRLEADLYFLLHTTADRTEGIRAFLEKRPPHFTGR
ncbi:MAG: enoyl-CoA hydratase/isomerase family protein [Chloroflexi bacterium]|nr:enoyl-CoA hydratase/isomerase family protein [Chloroflexota bacterium]